MGLTWDETLSGLQQDRGDEGAWSSLFDLGWPIAIAAAARQLGNVDNRLEDVAQETMFRVLKYCRFERISDGPGLRSYLKETARNAARDSFRSAARSGAAGLVDLENVVDERAVTGEMVVAAREILQHSSIQGLDRIDRQIVEGLIAGQSRADLQTVTGLNYSALTVRIHRLRNSLRKLLEGNELEE